MKDITIIFSLNILVNGQVQMNLRGGLLFCTVLFLFHYCGNYENAKLSRYVSSKDDLEDEVNDKTKTIGVVNCKGVENGEVCLTKIYIFLIFS